MNILKNAVPFIVVGILVATFMYFYSSNQNKQQTVEENPVVQQPQGKQSLPSPESPSQTDTNDTSKDAEVIKTDANPKEVTLINDNGEKISMDREKFVEESFGMLIKQMNGMITDVKYNPQKNNQVIIELSSTGKEFYFEKKSEMEKVISNGLHGVLATAGYVGVKETVYFSFNDENGNTLNTLESKETTKILK